MSANPPSRRNISTICGVVFIMVLFLVFATCISVFGQNVGGHLLRKFSQRSLGIPEGEVEELPPDQWFLQKLDHFSPTNTGTWWQRYQTNDRWFKNSSSSPVFLMIGGEGEIAAEWVVMGAWMDYAKTYNALCFQLEHRFYGKSQPKRDLSLRSLRYLSSEQALVDLAYFIDGMNQKYNLAPTNKWIVFGGSYPGSLAAWARLKFPHLIHAAISTSGPVLAYLNFKAYNDVVAKSLAASSPQCARNVHLGALQVLDALKKPNSSKKLTKKFNLCSRLDLRSKWEVSNFMESLALNFNLIVQYNNDGRLPTDSGSVQTVDDLCAIMTNQTIGSLIDRYAAVNSFVNGNDCVDVSYYDGIQELQNETAPSDARSWTYQTCTEFGWYETSNSRSDFFGSGFGLPYYINQCKAIFGDDFDLDRNAEGVRRTNIIYGHMNVADHVTNVMFVQGSLDPWHVLGVHESTNPNSPAILIRGTAHCANMYPASSKDLPELLEARRKISSFIGQVLLFNKPFF